MGFVVCSKSGTAARILEAKKKEREEKEKEDERAKREG